jgi:uncharacterized protein YwqG
MDRARIAALACEVGLDHLAAQLAAIALPALSLSEIDDDPRVGGNRVGGWPSLPGHESWPVVPPGRESAGTPMCFIAQIDLSEVPDWLIRGTGLLSLWCDGVEPHGPGAARAIVFPAGASLSDVPWPSDTPSQSRRRGQSVELLPELTLPGWCVYPALALEPLGIRWDAIDEVQDDAYSRLREYVYREQFSDAASYLTDPSQVFARDHVAHVAGREWDSVDDWTTGPRHQLGGHADHIQGDPLLESAETYLALSGERPSDDEHAFALARKWRLLLQNNHEWADGGSLYFCLPAEDLAEARFDRVQVTLQCC